MWDSIIGKHGHGVYVMEVTVALAFETGPKVSNEDLRAFVETNGLGFEAGGVVEAWELGGKEINEGGGRVIGFLNEVDDGAIEF